MKIDPTWAWQQFEPNESRPWDLQLAAHLHRRAAFSATPRDLANSVEAGLPASIERLFDFDAGRKFEAEMESTARFLTTGNEVRRVVSWWLLRMIRTPTPLLEKMTMFWHGHFATSAQKVTSAAAMLDQNRLLRQSAFGRMQPLVQAISRDVAMLTYLDSTANRKTRPNENYARELLELFCLGLDRYSEADIREIARCFTGWEVRKVSGAASFRFNEYQHDFGPKTVFGKTGNFDGDQAIEIILQRADARQFIARKLIRFFVFDDAEIPDALSQPIADRLGEKNFEIGAAVRMILESNLFFSDLAIGQKIRSPVELAIGLLRQFDASANMNRLMDDLKELGQLPLYPPNVKGWAGGRRWLNASTILGRANLVRRFAQQDGFSLRHESLAKWAKANGAPSQSAELVDWLCDLLLARPLSPQSRSSLHEIAAQSADRNRCIAELLTAISIVPEFSLN